MLSAGVPGLEALVSKRLHAAYRLAPALYWSDTVFGGTACGRVDGLAFEVTEDPRAVTCLLCKAKLAEHYAYERDGLHPVEERRRICNERAADRRAAERIVLERHAEEVEEEFVLKRLARPQ